MTILATYDSGLYRIHNKGRVIGEYVTWAEFNKAMDALDRLKAQLNRPEAFCDCKPKQEALR